MTPQERAEQLLRRQTELNRKQLTDPDAWAEQNPKKNPSSVFYRQCQALDLALVRFSAFQIQDAERRRAQLAGIRKVHRAMIKTLREQMNEMTDPNAITWGDLPVAGGLQ